VICWFTLLIDVESVVFIAANPVVRRDDTFETRVLVCSRSVETRLERLFREVVPSVKLVFVLVLRSAATPST
jgi:hypothetical protein